MSWRDSLRPASFRGLDFFVEGHEAGFGRRNVTHEFAQRDEPTTEDLGRKARTYRVDAYLLGDDYHVQRDKIIAACETEGAGELVHPYLGNLQVSCTGLSVSESSDEGRYCRLWFDFVESGESKYPTAATDPTRAVTKAANDVKDAAIAGCLSRFLTDRMPSFVLDAAVAQITGLADVFSSLPVNPLAEAQAVADFFDRVRSLAEKALALATDPPRMVGAVTGIIGDVREVFDTRASTVLGTLTSAYSAPYSGPTATPSRLQQQANTEALSGLVRRAALAEQAKIAVERAEASAQAIASRDPGAILEPGLFQTREDAIAARDALTDAIDVEMEDPGTTDDEFVTLNALRAELVRGVPSPGLRLPRVANVTPTATLPSLVVSYQVYGTAARAVEIAERNKAGHPGFLRGGNALQVITDG
ncbi:MAG TPA: DNA circularization N-terminal domain-containing protein [Pseudoxanthomonas sp.]